MGVFINIQNSLITALMFKVHFCHTMTDWQQNQNFASNSKFFINGQNNITWCDINYIIMTLVKNSGSCEPCAHLKQKKLTWPYKFLRV